MTSTAAPLSQYSVLDALQKKYEARDAEAEAAAAAAGVKLDQNALNTGGEMGQRLANLEFNQMLTNQPMNRPDAGFGQALWAGSGQIDPKTGKPAEVDPAVYTQRLQQVMQQRPDLLWPGMNRDGTIQREFTGDRYDR